MNKLKIAIYICATVFVVSFTLLVDTLIEEEYVFPSKLNKQVLSDRVELEVKEVKTFFKYNITADGTKYTKKELIKNGGDCEQWADYYIDLFSEDYNTKRINISREGVVHVFALVWSKKEHCIIDQKSYKCFKKGNISNIKNIH